MAVGDAMRLRRGLDENTKVRVGDLGAVLCDTGKRASDVLKEQQSNGP